jgi:hypothetical protein
MRGRRYFYFLEDFKYELLLVKAGLGAGLSDEIDSAGMHRVEDIAR